MKTSFLLILFTLALQQLAFCETATFKIGATIPQIVGINYFPDTALENPVLKMTGQEQLLVLTHSSQRDGQDVIIKTVVVK